MKRDYTRGEKALLLSPLLLLAMAGGFWQWSQNAAIKLGAASDNLVVSLTFSPDGKRLAALHFVDGTQARAGSIFEVESAQELCQLQIPPLIPSPKPAFPPRLTYFEAAAWSDDGTRLVAGYSDLSRGLTKIRTDPDLEFALNPIRFNDIGKWAIWDTRTGTLNGNYLYAPANEDSRSSAMRFSLDGKTVLGFGNPPSEFDANTGARRRRVYGGTLAGVREVKTGETSGLQAANSRQKHRFQVFDPKAKKVVWEPKVGTALEFSWHGDILGVLDWPRSRSTRRKKGARLLLWNAKTRQSLPSHALTRTAMSLQFHPDGRRLCYVLAVWHPSAIPTEKYPRPDTGEIVIYDYRQGRELRRIPTESSVTELQWSPDGRWLAAVVAISNLAELHLFDAAGQLQWSRSVRSMIARWSPDSKLIATVLPAGTSKTQIALLPVSE